MCSGSGELASELSKRDSDSSSWSDGSHCSLSSLRDVRQVAFVRKAKDVPGRAVSLPEALPYDDARCDSTPTCGSASCCEGCQQHLNQHHPGDKACKTQTGLDALATLQPCVRALEHGMMSRVDCRYVTSARGSRAPPVRMEAHAERRSLDSDGGSEMDADCCGDSGELALIPAHPCLQISSQAFCMHVPGWQPAGSPPGSGKGGH